MKNNIAMFFNAILCASCLAAQTDMPTTAESDIVLDVSNIIAETITIPADTIDQLAPLRALVAQQVKQIQSILTTLSETVKTSNLPDKKQLGRELDLVCGCMQTIAQALPEMNKQALTHLIDLNSIVLNQLQTQLINGNISGLCHFTAAQFTTPQQQARSFITIEQLQEKIAQLQEQIKDVWQLVTVVSVPAYSESAQARPSSLWQKTINNKNTIIASLSGLCAAALICKYCTEEQRSLWISRFINYTLMSLYVLRQKKDADIKNLANRWFGEETLLAHAMNATKYYVGSPKEKLPALHIIARNDMTAKEQIAWAEQQNCAVLKTEKGRDYSAVKDFFDLEDGLFKLPVAFFFAHQIKKDMTELSKFIDAGANGFFNRLADLINGKK